MSHPKEELGFILMSMFHEKIHSKKCKKNAIPGNSLKLTV